MWSCPSCYEFKSCDAYTNLITTKAQLIMVRTAHPTLALPYPFDISHS